MSRRTKPRNDFAGGENTLLDAHGRLAQAGLRAKKSWGQNFLQDETVLRDIAAATQAGPQNPVLELGAGLGALTHYLLERGGAVWAIERDRELVPLLRAQFPDNANLNIIEADAAKLDYAALAEQLGSGPITVAGNLPYQLSGRILGSLGEVGGAHVKRAVLLVQNEVAERLCCEPGSRTYGLLSVLVQRAYKPRIVRVVSPRAFHPRPAVYSAVVELVALTPDEAPWQTTVDDATLVKTAKAAFSARRKTLRNALSGGLRLAPSQIETALAGSGIDVGVRAETLGVSDFAKLTASLVAAGLFDNQNESETR